MKKVIIIIAFIMPLFVINNLQAQNNNNGAPNFDIHVHVSAPQQCPSSGIVKGDTPELGSKYTAYNGLGTIYYFVWNGTLSYAQPVSAEVTTGHDAIGYWCHDKKTETLTASDQGHHFYLHLDLIAPDGGNGQ